MPNSAFKVLDVTWADLKTYQTRDSLTLYYVAVDSSYEVIAITKGFIYRTFLVQSADITDFTTNYLSGASAASSLDDVIGTVNKLDVINSVLLDANFNSLAPQSGTTTAGNQGGLLFSGFDGTNARLVAVGTSGHIKIDNFDGSGTALTSTSGVLNVGITGANTVKLNDGSGNALTSTSSALDINLKTSSINLPISIAAQTLAAVSVSATNAANTVSNPIFVELSNGTAAFGTTGHPVFVNLQDGSGTGLSSASGVLNVGLTGANTVKLNDSAGTGITLNTGGSLKNTLYDAAGNVAIGTKGSAFPGTAGVVIVGGSDGTNAQSLAMTTGGLAKVALSDGSANALTSTSSALDINIKTSSINVPVSIAAQTLAAVAISKTNVANAVANPIFVELSDGTNAFGTSAHAIFINIQDGSGNALTSTSNKLDVGLTGANTVKLNDSAGTAITLNTGGSLKNTIYDAAGNVAVGTKGSAFPGTAGVVIVGGTDGTNAQAIATDTSGRVKVNNFDGSGNALTSTSSALDVNLKTSSINIPISIAAQTLAAVSVSATNAANTVSNPIFVELSNGAAAFGTSSAPVFVNLKDGSGNALTSTSNKLDVGLTGANTVKLNDSAGSAITLSGSNLQTSLFDSAGDAAVVKDAVATPANRGVVMVAGNDGTNIRLFATDTSGRVKVNNFDGSGNALTSTSSALDINLKTSSINVPVSIAAQTLTAVTVSATSAANTVSNPLFVELSNGAAAFGTSSAPVFVNLKDGSGNALTSTAGGNSSRLLDVIIRDIFSTVSDHVFQTGSLTTTATTADQVIVTYIVPAGKDFLLIGFNIGKSAATGADAAPFKVRINGTAKMIYATDGAGTRFWNPSFGGFPVKIATAADVVTITVTPSTATSTVWNGALFAYLRTI